MILIIRIRSSFPAIFTVLFPDVGITTFILNNLFSAATFFSGKVGTVDVIRFVRRRSDGTSASTFTILIVGGFQGCFRIEGIVDTVTLYIFHQVRKIHVWVSVALYLIDILVAFNLKSIRLVSLSPLDKQLMSPCLEGRVGTLL